MISYKLGRLRAAAEYAAAKLGITIECLENQKLTDELIELWVSYVKTDHLMTNRIKLILPLVFEIEVLKNINKHSLIDGYEFEKNAIESGLKILKLRKKARITQRELAKKLKVSLSTIKSWEAHKRNCPFGMLKLTEMLIGGT